MQTYLMKRSLICKLLILIFVGAFSEELTIDRKIFDALRDRYPMLRGYFKEAYAITGNIPEGLLEAISFTQTRMRPINPDVEEKSCIGLPGVWGVMGLMEDGKGFFVENIKEVARVSGFSIKELKYDTRKNIIGSAILISKYLRESKNKEVRDRIYEALRKFSYIPGGDVGLEYAKDVEIFEILRFMEDSEFCNIIGAKKWEGLLSVFGENLKILKSKKVNWDINRNIIYNDKGDYFVQTCTNPPDYPLANWNPADPSNYSNGRGGCSITAITIHTTQGSYFGTIAWFKNPSADVSAHYVLRSSDGAVTQMVCEVDKAWHVGTENCYTIGYEHEGWVSDPSWYTMAMYQSSANIVKYDAARWNIFKHRTCWWDWAAVSTILVLGNCTKVKGHQHYPNQNHTDPGQYWNWDLYYKLVNDPPLSVQTYTQASGTLYDSGGPSGNYSDDERKVYVISPPGAASITLNFTSFDLEANWDYLYIYDGNSVWAPLLWKGTGSNLPPSITSSGGSITIEFRSDCATTAAGWALSWTSTTQDTIPPTTQVNAPSGWQTSNFTVTFQDVDNQSGVASGFWRVDELRPQGYFSCNPAYGFFLDLFNYPQMDTHWTIFTGTWSQNNNILSQSDESVNNTNIYAYVAQVNAYAYLYTFKAKFNGGTSTNRRLGIHIFVDNPTAYNRGNSYLIWFRLDNQKFQLYKIVNDTLNLVKDIPLTIQDNTWYKYHVYYNPQTGQIKVWRDWKLVDEWQDSAPLQAGNYISLRTGNAIVDFDDIAIYKSRGSTKNVLIGPNGVVRFENPSPSQPSCRIVSMAMDNANNLSQPTSKLVNIDWTPPIPSIVMDSISIDIDTLEWGQDLHSSWFPFKDSNSGLLKYEVALGYTPGDSSIATWQSTNLDTHFIFFNSILPFDTTVYVNVRCYNNAGLYSLKNSDGVFIKSKPSAPLAAFSIIDTILCYGDSLKVINNSTYATSFQWYASQASPSYDTNINPSFLYNSSGNYTITLIANGPGGSDTSSISFYLTVEQPPIASFYVLDDTLYLPNAFAAFVNTSQNASHYLWYFGDGATSQDANPWHQYTQAGWYSVILIAYGNKCSPDTLEAPNLILVLDVPGYIQNITNFNVLPENYSTFYVYDAKGILIHILSNKPHEITLTPGMYLIIAEAPNKPVKKFKYVKF